MSTDTPKPGPKAQIDALLLKLPGVSARKINGLDAYFVSDQQRPHSTLDGQTPDEAYFTQLPLAQAA